MGMSFIFLQRNMVLCICLTLAVLSFLVVSPTTPTNVWMPISDISIGMGAELDPKALLSTNLSTIGNSSETIDAYVTTPSGVCDNSSTFLVYVLARPTEFERRDVIRRTWANTVQYNSSCVQHGFNIQVIFAMGLSPNMSHSDRDRLSQEVTQHQDIWIGQFEDTYDNLVLKGIGVLSWIKDTCPREHIDFVMKIDDDVFPNLFSLLKMAWCRRPGVNETTWPHFICTKHKWLGVVRDSDGPYAKYRVSYEEYREDYYPPYCNGGLYILSREGLSVVVQGTNITRPFRMEDVYLTGIAPLAVQPDRRIVPIQYLVFSRRMRMKRSFRFHSVHDLPINMYEGVLSRFVAKYCGQPSATTCMHFA